MFVDFHSVYERYSQEVYRFTYFLCGDAALAEDITQETFVRAWTTPGQVRVGTVKAYLFMIARNLYRAELKRGSQHVALDAALPDTRHAQVASDARLDLDDVLQALRALPEIDRAALLMHAQEGMPYAEIAAALGLSLSAVKVRIHRARIKLKSQEKTQKGTGTFCSKDSTK
jgi:RNA polymerase sigma-70 factor (ECF subfamily)